MKEEESNPLLQVTGLPCFSAVRPEHLKGAVQSVIARCKKAVTDAAAAAIEGQPSWETLMSPLEEADDAFSRAWGTASHLNGVCNTPELRNAYDECLPLVSNYASWAGQYRPLYEAVKKLGESEASASFTGPQQKAIANSLRDFRLTGVDLEGEARQRFAEINSRLSQLESTFANNVLDATQSWVLEIRDEADLKGLPSGVIRLAKHEAEKRGQEGWVFTLDAPSYVPFLTYAENRGLREKIYRAYNTRASELGPDAGKWDNAPIMEEILKLRHEKAKLLGFKTYAHLSLATKMAESPEQVLEFLYSLADKSYAQGQAEMEALRAFAQEHGQEELKPWDVTFWSEKLRQERYAYNAEELREYFPMDQVLKGLFECARRLYQISFRPLKADVWDPEVRCYVVLDEFGSHIGTLYMDFFARTGKRGGAWMDECITRRWCSDGTMQLPAAYLVCNFTPPVKGRVSQLTHNEVVTLFHEFGHCMNQILTRIDTPDVSGINGVPWDAVELASQFNENFAWQEEVLNFLSRSIHSGKPLPREKLDALLAAKNFESAMAMLRQLESAIFDMRLHLEYDDSKGGRVQELLAEVRKRVAVIPIFEEGRFPNSFTHIFAGGYAAGYYSYKWAEVLAADAFGRFLEEGLFTGSAGRDFRLQILAAGGAADPMQAFVAFRGRKPEVDALLKQSGITPQPAPAA